MNNGKATAALLGGTLVGAASGFLSRPCCVVPMVLSVAGVSSAGLAQAFVDHGLFFVSAGGIMLALSLWINVRREGGWFNKSLAAAASVIAFALSGGLMGVL